MPPFTVGTTRARRGAPEQSCWLVYLGSGTPGPPDGDDLTLAAVTGSEADARAMLDEARVVRTDRTNMIEDRPFRSTDPSILDPGTQRTVFVVVTGDELREEGRVVCDSRAEADALCEDLHARGLSDARVRGVVTHTWLVEP